MLLTTFAIVLWHVGLSAAANDTDCPVNVPGFTHHGNCDLLCRGANWEDIITFYLGNYVAHAATVNSRPGQSLLETIGMAVVVLLFPGAGIVSAMEAIFSKAVGGATDLQKAARAGALYTVVKENENDERAESGDEENSLGDNRPKEDQGIGTSLGAAIDSVMPFRKLLRADSAEEIQMHSVQADVGSTVEGPDVASTSKPPDTSGTNVDGTPGTVKPDTNPEDSTKAKEQLDTTDRLLEPVDVRPSIISPSYFGLTVLPKGYTLVCLPWNATFIDDQPDESKSVWNSIKSGLASPFKPAPSRIHITSEYNLIKIVISIVQLLFACMTLYKTKGDQIDKFGYAAFGLTVAPYAWMSLLNLIGSMIRPGYASRYIVGSASLDEFQADLENYQNGSMFRIEGIVGRIDDKTEKELKTSDKGRFLENRKAYAGGAIYVGAISLAVVGGLSRFANGESALYQRAWTMTWLVFGFAVGPTFVGTIPAMAVQISRSKAGKRLGKMPLFWQVYLACIVAVVMSIYVAPAIGGFVTVGQMIIQYGVCTDIS